MEEPRRETKFHDLDVVSLELVCKHLMLTDIFELSMTTKDIRQSLGKAGDPIRSIFISFDPLLPKIRLESNNQEFIWTFGYPPGELKDAGEYKIGKFTYHCKSSATGYHTLHHDIEHGMIEVIRYLVSIFNCSEAVIKELSIDLAVIEDCMAMCRHFKLFKNVERLAIHQAVDREGNSYHFSKCLEWIFANLNINEIYMGAEYLEHRLMKTRSGAFDIMQVPMRMDMILKTNHICIAQADWITPEDLLSMDVETGILRQNNLKEEHINAFIKQWLNSDSNKLSWFEINLYDGFDLAKITEGLELEPATIITTNTHCSCPYRRYEELKNVKFEFPSDSKKITRSNGTDSATISIKDNLFFFHVKDDGPITAPNAAEMNRNERQERIAQRVAAIRAMRGGFDAPPRLRHLALDNMPDEHVPQIMEMREDEFDDLMGARRQRRHEREEERAARIARHEELMNARIERRRLAMERHEREMIERRNDRGRNDRMLRRMARRVIEIDEEGDDEVEVIAEYHYR